MKYRKLYNFLHIIEAIVLIPTHIVTFLMFYFSNHQKTTEEIVDKLYDKKIGHLFSVIIWLAMYLIWQYA